jgi:hypothetical protein
MYLLLFAQQNLIHKPRRMFLLSASSLHSYKLCLCSVNAFVQSSFGIQPAFVLDNAVAEAVT